MSETVFDPTKPTLQAVPVDSLWFDPFVLNVACSVQTTERPLTAGAVALIAPANVNRVAIGFFLAIPTVQISVAPWPDLGAHLFAQLAQSAASNWYNLFTFGPLIANAWYGQSVGPTTIRCVEIIRN